MRFDETIDRYLENKKDPLRFIQLGCNDGFMADPLYRIIEKKECEGLMVDADSYYLKNASQRHIEKNRLRYLHGGIVPLENTNNLFGKFYSINPEAIRPSVIHIEDKTYWRYGDKIHVLPAGYENVDPIKNNVLDYLQGIGSFDYDFVLKHIDSVTKKSDASGALSRQIFTTDKSMHTRFVKMHFVPLFNINQIFNFSQFKDIDLLQTDLETWDIKIMNDIDKFALKPNIIHFEAPGGISSDIEKKFVNAGYSIERTTDTRDYLAIKMS